jgi:eukaryotic-like serine/threonine-protein kinase
VTASNLREQLQLALGTAYTLEHELGGGGMSRVFVATEVALDRRVVVKVLPEEMVGQVSLERFKREIALAARLQNPHVVPLLTAGDAGGLPYFTMPLVEGESLRARIARQGELPLSEAMRLLREIASALAYAHDRGIVHRDIKPDNVLLSGGSAMITDFGVAKAISASSNSEAGNTTSMGVALGTPAYMSPEQASADPAVDHRADIYAFGVLAYELLTGQPPFSGRTPQGLLAAHVTETPEFITRRRQTIPPALGNLVMRCLEKRAADRPQTALDLVHGLDQITTPSGGSAPTTAVAAVKSETTTTAATSAATPVNSRAGRWMGIAAALVVLAGAAWFAFTKTAGVAASAPRRIAVLPTEMGSDTAHAYLADGLSGELTTRLSKIPGLVVRAYSSSKAMHGKPLGEAGKTLDVSSLLTASLMRSGNRLRVTASLIDPTDESVQWSETFEESDQDQFALQDKLVNAIAGALKLTLSPDVRAKVEARGTRSAEALDLVQRSFFLTDQFTAASLQQAVSLAELAIEKDSLYAGGWAALAYASGTLADDFVSPLEVVPRMRRAVERSLALDPSSADAHAQAGDLHMWYDWDPVSARRAFEQALVIDSTNVQAARSYSRLLSSEFGESGDSAFAVLERGIRSNPGAVALLRQSTGEEHFRRLSPAQREQRCRLLAQLEGSPSFVCAARQLQLAGRADSARQMSLGRLRSITPAEREGLRGGAMTGRAGAFLAAGDTVSARVELNAAVARSAREYVREDGIAEVFFALGDIEQAVQWWDRAVNSNSARVLDVLHMRRYEALRRDPRAQEMIRRARAKASQR